MKKLLLTAVLTASMLAAGINIAAANEEKTVTIDGADYSYSIGGSGVTITKVKTTSSNLTIPKTIEDIDIIEIGNLACEELKINRIQIPDTVTRIGELAFAGCVNLKEVEIPDSVTEMGENCFGECAGLKEVKLSANCKSISSGCFAKCKSLEDVEIPDGVTKIGTSAFVSCTSLKSVVIPDSVKEIGGTAFCHDEMLSDISWDKNVEKIGLRVFDGTRWLADAPQGYLVLNRGKLLYRYAGSAKDVSVPDSITEIASGAFQKTDIESITIPACVDEIPYLLCYDCTRLESVKIAEGVTGIGKSVFSGCTSLKNVSLPHSLTYISGTAFMECKALESIAIPNEVVAIGERCFYECESLASMHLPSGLKKLGSRVFVGCKSLKKINIPAGVIENFDGDTFVGVTNLADVTVEGPITSRLAEALRNAGWKGATEWNIIEGVLISYNGNDDNVVIPDGVIEIGEKAFANSDVESVVIPFGVTKIGIAAFYKQERLKTVTIPGSVRVIGQLAFSDCTALGEVIFEYSNDALALGASSFQFAAVSPDTVITNGRNVLNILTAFTNTALDPEADEYIDPAATAAPTAKPNAAPKQKTGTISVKSGDTIMVYLDDEKIIFPDAEPFIDDNGRTQIPIRAVAEALGCEVKWDSGTRTAAITKGDIVISIGIGKNIIQVGREVVEMDTAAEIVDDRTYIPVRFVGEALGMKVNWTGGER